MDFQKSSEAPTLGNVSSSSCHDCQELVKELQLKDKIIQELREKLKNIQQICNSGASSFDSVCGHQGVLEPKIVKNFNVGNAIALHHSSKLANTFRTPPVSSDSESSVDGAKDDNTGFNLKLVKHETSPTIASIKLEVFDEEHQGSNSNSSFPSYLPLHHHQENRNEVSKITVQEIIDKVIERSPKRDDSLKTRNVENICNSFNTLLSQLESQAEKAKERNQSEPWNGSSEDQSNSSNEQTFVNRPPPSTATTSGSNSCTDLVLHSNSKRNLYSCPTIPNTTATTTEISSLKAKPNNNMNEATNSSSFGLSDNSSRKRKSFAAASSSEQPSSSSSSTASFPSSTNSNFHHPPPPAVGHHHHHFVYYPKSIPTFPCYTPTPQQHQQLGNMESSNSKSHHFLQCPKCSRTFSTHLTLMVHVKDCCQDVNVTPTVTPTPAFNFAVCYSTSNNSSIGGGMAAETMPDQIPKAVLNRIPIGTDISMVYNMHDNSNHACSGVINAKSNYVKNGKKV